MVDQLGGHRDQRADDDQGENPERRSPSHFELREADREGVHCKRFGRRAWTAPRQHVDRVEEPERIHQPDDQDEQDERPERRDNDVIQQLPAAGPVDAPGIDQVLIHRLKPGIEHQDHERRELPRIGNDHRELGPSRIAEPVRSKQIERRQRRIDQPPARHKHPLDEQCRDNRGNDQRNELQHDKDAGAALQVVKADGDRKADHELQPNRAARDNQSVYQ